MALGTALEIQKSTLVNGAELDEHEMYILLRVLEKLGGARILGNKTNDKVVGRKPKIYETVNRFELKFSQISS